MTKRKKARPSGVAAGGARRTPAQITPRPEQGRQIEGGDLVVLWRDEVRPGRRTGLAMTVDSCRSAECACRLVKLDGLVVPDDVAAIESTGDALRVSQWPDGEVGKPKRRILVEVDIETGEVAPILERETPDPELLAWVTSEVDGELLDRLHERWRIGKGWTGRSRVRRVLELDDWKPGELLGLDEVYEAERHDCFVVEETSYWAHLLLCPVPSCDCHLAEVMFGAVDGKKPGDVGRVRLALRFGEAEVIARLPEPGREALLDVLWRRFSTRHTVGPYLAAREARMRMAWPALERAVPVCLAPSTSLLAPAAR